MLKTDSKKLEQNSIDELRTQLMTATGLGIPLGAASIALMIVLPHATTPVFGICVTLAGFAKAADCGITYFRPMTAAKAAKTNFIRIITHGFIPGAQVAARTADFIRGTEHYQSKSKLLTPL